MGTARKREPDSVKYHGYDGQRKRLRMEEREDEEEEEGFTSVLRSLENSDSSRDVKFQRQQILQPATRRRQTLCNCVCS